MSLFFKPKSDLFFRLGIIGVFSLIIWAGVLGEVWKWSSYETEVGVPVQQPVAFSHKHHVGQLGLDCRFCHSTVETSASAGIPPMHTCMSCHSQIWTRAPMLKPVRDSLVTETPVKWNRVYQLPKFVYFNHSIHVNKGIGCVSCHGEVDRMPLTTKVRSFYMRDCLGCHRNPEKYFRPKNEVFNLHWISKPFLNTYHIPKERLTDCVTCHR